MHKKIIYIYMGTRMCPWLAKCYRENFFNSNPKFSNSTSQPREFLNNWLSVQPLPFSLLQTEAEDDLDSEPGELLDYVPSANARVRVSHMTLCVQKFVKNSPKKLMFRYDKARLQATGFLIVGTLANAVSLYHCLVEALANAVSLYHCLVGALANAVSLYHCLHFLLLTAAPQQRHRRVEHPV